MTKNKGDWKSKEFSQLFILRKLADGSQLPSPAFESSRSKLNFRDTNDGVKNKEGIPHSSTVKRLHELLESESIRIVKGETQSKKKFYEIDLLGYIKLLSLCNENEFYPDIMENYRKYMPLFSNTVDNLKSHFTEKQLFETMVSVCKNSKIEIIYDRDKKRKDPHSFSVFSSARFMLKEYEWVRTYTIEIKVRQLKFTSTFIRSKTVGGVVKDIRKKTGQALTLITGLLHSAFIYELIMRCERPYKEFSTYPKDPKVIKSVIDHAINNTVLLPFFIQFLEDIKARQDLELYQYNKLSAIFSTIKLTGHAKKWQDEVQSLFKSSFKF